MRRLRSTFITVGLLAAITSALAVGTFAQAWCCARDAGCSVQVVSDACETSAGCGGMACAERPAPVAAGDSAPATPAAPADPCEPSPERCPLLVTAPAEPARSRPSDSAPDDIAAFVPHAAIAIVDAIDAHAPEITLHPRAPVVPQYLRYLRLLI